MWRSSKRLIVSCVQFVFRCGRDNLEAEDLDDISDYDVQDVPGNAATTVGRLFAPRELNALEGAFNSREYNLISREKRCIAFRLALTVRGEWHGAYRVLVQFHFHAINPRQAMSKQMSRATRENPKCFKRVA